jgi:hypothetical protein
MKNIFNKIKESLILLLDNIIMITLFALSPLTLIGMICSKYFDTEPLFIAIIIITIITLSLLKTIYIIIRSIYKAIKVNKRYDKMCEEQGWEKRIPWYKAEDFKCFLKICLFHIIIFVANRFLIKTIIYLLD